MADGFTLIPNVDSPDVARPWRAIFKRNVALTRKQKDTDEDEDATEGEPTPETVVREQTVVTEQAMASSDPIPVIVYTVSLFVANALVSILGSYVTDQTFLLIGYTLAAFVVLMGLYQIVLRIELPNAEDETARNEDERRRAYQSAGRWAQNLLFIINFARSIVMLTIVALCVKLLLSLFAPSLPATSTMMVLTLFIELILVVAFLSHPSVGMLTHSNAFLGARARDDP